MKDKFFSKVDYNLCNKKHLQKMVGGVCLGWTFPDYTKCGCRPGDKCEPGVQYKKDLTNQKTHYLNFHVKIGMPGSTEYVKCTIVCENYDKAAAIGYDLNSFGDIDRITISKTKPKKESGVNISHRQFKEYLIFNIANMVWNLSFGPKDNSKLQQVIDKYYLAGEKFYV